MGAWASIGVIGAEAVIGEATKEKEKKDPLWERLLRKRIKKHQKKINRQSGFSTPPRQSVMAQSTESLKSTETVTPEKTIAGFNSQTIMLFLIGGVIFGIMVRG